EIEIADDDAQEAVEVVRDAAGELADRLEPLRPPLAFLRGDALGHVAAYEIVPLLRLGPDAGPAQRHDVAVLVDIPAVDVARELAAPGETHFVSGVFEVLVIDVGRGAAADHFLGPVTEDRERAGA